MASKRSHADIELDVSALELSPGAGKWQCATKRMCHHAAYKTSLVPAPVFCPQQPVPMLYTEDGMACCVSEASTSQGSSSYSLPDHPGATVHVPLSQKLPGTEIPLNFW